jgi:L-ribulose-5-phosphate 4-epimerase
MKALKEAVCEANLALTRQGLVFSTWGNASAIDRERGLVVIKPSGVAYESMRAEDMAVIDLAGKVVEGALRPSVDLPAHLALYQGFPDIGGVVHTHSHWATCFAQARRSIPCLGTTHADYFHGEVPLADALSETDVAENYERHIGEVIARRFDGMNPLHFPAVLAAGHGPFTWGVSVAAAVEAAAVLEEVARTAAHTLQLGPEAPSLEPYLLDKHFLRKHGPDAYYGQDGETEEN